MQLYIYFLLGCMLPTLYGQSIVPHTLCDNNTVTVEPKSSGVIQHIQNNLLSSTSCTLILRSFTYGSYVSIPGVDGYKCNNNHPRKISINGQPYCVRGSLYNNSTIIHLSSDQLSVHITSGDVTTFAINYYSNGKSNLANNSFSSIGKPVT